MITSAKTMSGQSGPDQTATDQSGPDQSGPDQSVDRFPVQTADRLPAEAAADAEANAEANATVDSAVVAEINDLSFRLMWRLRQDALRAFEPLGLRPLKVFVLELIARGILHPKELAEIMDAAPPAVSSLLSSLEEQGLVRRELDETDRRRVRLALTDKGEGCRRQLRDAWCRMTAERVARVAPADLEAVRRVYLTLLEEA